MSIRALLPVLDHQQQGCAVSANSCETTFMGCHMLPSVTAAPGRDVDSTSPMSGGSANAPPCWAPPLNMGTHRGGWNDAIYNFVESSTSSDATTTSTTFSDEFAPSTVASKALEPLLFNELGLGAVDLQAQGPYGPGYGPCDEFQPPIPPTDLWRIEAHVSGLCYGGSEPGLPSLPTPSVYDPLTLLRPREMVPHPQPSPVGQPFPQSPITCPLDLSDSEELKRCRIHGRLAPSRRRGPPSGNGHIHGTRHFTCRPCTYILNEFFKVQEYPTPEEKRKLLTLVGMERHQLDNWFCNKRRKKLGDGSGNGDAPSE